MSHILAAGAARMKLEAENYEARIAALEAQLAELAAENERLTKLLSGRDSFIVDQGLWGDFVASLPPAKQSLASTGAVKEAGAKLAKAVFGVDLKHHPRATNPIVAHETANVSDKPEGQQEPVAFQWRKLDRVMKHEEVWSHVDYHSGLKIAARPDKYEVRPLFTRPSEQAVTEAMVEAAAEEIVDTAEIDFNGTIINRLDVARAALKAAMEVGR